MQQEDKLTVADARQTRAEPAGGAARVFIPNRADDALNIVRLTGKEFNASLDAAEIVGAPAVGASDASGG